MFTFTKVELDLLVVLFLVGIVWNAKYSKGACPLYSKKYFGMIFEFFKDFPEMLESLKQNSSHSTFKVFGLDEIAWGILLLCFIGGSFYLFSLILLPVAAYIVILLNLQ